MNEIKTKFIQMRPTAYGNPFLLLGGFLVLSLGLISFAQAKERPQKSKTEFSNEKILEKSQISYRAEGGFSGIRSFSVILSCVNGRISTLKSLHDPRQDEENVLRINGTLDSNSYLNLWRALQKIDVLSMKDAPNPKSFIHDEFTYTFETKVGDVKNEFNVYGVSRPEAARYYAVKNLMDTSVNMKSLLKNSEKLAMR